MKNQDMHSIANGDHHRVVAKEPTISSAAKRPLRCMVWFWLSFVLVLSPIGRCSCSMVVVLDCSNPRCSIHDRLDFRIGRTVSGSHGRRNPRMDLQVAVETTIPRG